MGLVFLEWQKESKKFFRTDFMKQFFIDLDQKTGIIHADDNISGKVILITNKPFSASKISLTIAGDSDVRWQETRSEGHFE